MRRLKGWLRVWLLAGSLAGGLACGSAAAEPLVLNATNMLELGETMLRAGQPAQALAFSDALIAAGKGTARAHVLRSRAARGLGQGEAAIASARAAWRMAEGPDRFGAAMAMAQGLASDGQKFRAQFWLRRAGEVAPTDAARRLAERDFRYVRSRSRLSLRIDATLRPSSNVNNGSTEGVLDFFGLPLVLSGDAQALSGLEAQIGIRARYRLAESAKGKTDLRLGWTGKAVRLSDAARAQAPAAEASDYAFAALEAGLERTFRLGRAEAVTGVVLGHNWYGGQDMSDYARLDLGVNRALNARTKGNLRLSVERQDRLDVARRSATVTTFGAGLVHGLANRDQLGLSVTAARTASAESDIDHDRVEARLSWAKAAPVMGMEVSASFTLEGRDYDRSRYSAGGREDLSVSADLNLAFPEMDYLGFMPVVTFEASRTDSNVALYRSQSLGLGFSIQSKF